MEKETTEELLSHCEVTGCKEPVWERSPLCIACRKHAEEAFKKMKKETTPKYVLLHFACTNDDNDEEGSFEVAVKFKNVKEWEDVDGMSYDSVYGGINKTLPGKWYVNDVPEPVRDLTEEEYNNTPLRWEYEWS